MAWLQLSSNKDLILILTVFLRALAAFIVVVKKTFRYSNVFSYNPLCRHSVIRNIIMESGIILGEDAINRMLKTFLPRFGLNSELAF